MRILAIESTCDETGVAVVEGDIGGVKILTNVVASSAEIHQKYGGVVPEVAAREQIKVIVPVIEEAIHEMTNGKLQMSNYGVGKWVEENIDAIAVTYGSGLVGSLLIGVETAKTLAWGWNKPLIRVNHMVAHVAANWIVNDNKEVDIELPALGLIVSGGHTDLVFMNNENDWEWIGGTRDDAAGEAFDKGARILGLPYPGGPSIQQATMLAENYKLQITNNKLLTLPRPMLDQNNLEMSFSGLKAALSKITNDKLKITNDLGITEEMFTGLMAKEFNEAIVDVLVAKTQKAIDEYQPKSLLVAGGVAANKRLREKLGKEISIPVFVPEFKYCTDNAAMVGAAAILRPDFVEPRGLKADSGLTVV